MSLIYPGGDAQVTSNYGLATFGMDEVLAENMILIDSAIAGASSVTVNGSVIHNPNFNGTLPTAPASKTNVTFQVDISGNVSAYYAATAPAGSSTDIQFNNAGVFGGSDSFQFNSSTNIMTLSDAHAVLNVSGIDGQLSISDTTAPTVLSGGSHLYISDDANSDANENIEVHGTYAMGMSIYVHSATLFRFPVINTFKSRGTLAAPSAVLTGDVLGALSTSGYDGTTYGGSGTKGAFFEAQASENWDSTHHGASFAFFTTDNGTNATKNTLFVGDMGAGSAVQFITPANAPTDALMNNGAVTLYLDESGNNLKVRVKYSNGTLKTAVVPLV
jgi:hypothetical protein